MMPEISAGRDIRENGLEHLTGALQALEEDFQRLDEAIDGLRETLRISPPSGEAKDPLPAPPPPRSVIEYVSREVQNLRLHNENQRMMIEWIRESIQ